MEATTLKGNRIIEIIHNDFYSMDSKTDNKIQKQLNIAYDIESKELANKMESLGLTRSSIHNDFRKDVIDSREQLNDILNQYSTSYPTHKYITDESIKELCVKYNLIIAPLECYIGDIPLKNQKELASFKSKHPEIKKSFIGKTMYSDRIRFVKTVYRDFHSIHRGTDGSKKVLLKNNFIRYVHYSILKNGTEIAKDEYNGLIEEITRLLGYTTKITFEGIESSIPRLTHESEFFIAATSNLLNITGYELNSNNEAVIYSDISEKHVNADFEDPIIFKKLDKGAIIVTAWGEEASDELVVNEKFN